MGKKLSLLGCTGRVTIVVTQGEMARGLCVFGCGNDSSLYVEPFARKGQYFFGRQTLDCGAREKSFAFHTQERQLGKRPHLSVHESGAVRIRSGRKVAAARSIPALKFLRGQHFATVRADRFCVLPDIDLRNENCSGSIFVVRLESTVESIKAVIYANGSQPAFAAEPTLTLLLPNAAQPIWIGVRMLADHPIGCSDSTNEGITIISGWDPTKDAQVEQDVLFLRSV
jgi:hypothetical protein